MEGGDLSIKSSETEYEGWAVAGGVGCACLLVLQCMHGRTYVLTSMYKRGHHSLTKLRVSCLEHGGQGYHVHVPFAISAYVIVGLLVCIF